MSGLAFDLVALFLFTAFAAYGWSSGLIASVGGLLGAIFGLILEYFTVPLVLNSVDNAKVRFMVGIVFGFLLVVLCSLACELWSVWLRESYGLKKSRASRMGGLVAKVLMALLLVWVFMAPLSVQPNTTLGQVGRHSVVMRGLNAALPEPAHRIPEMLDASARTASLEQIRDRSAQLAASDGRPNSLDIQSPAIARTRSSVVKIMGQATDCNRELEGTGFVYSPGLVVTNAHVIAGAREITVKTAKGDFAGRPVVFDPLRDVAVLWVPEIAKGAKFLPALVPARESTVEPGQTMAIPGFPNNGPYRMVPARLLEHFILRGPGIYGTTIVERQAYTLLSGVTSGNSGGPILNSQGHYVGLLFGVATDKTNTAYALTVREINPVLQKGRINREKVSTGRCTPMPN